jgi:hypothetical protein
MTTNPPQGPYVAPAPPVMPYVAPVQTTPKVDGLAIAALVLGITWCYWVGSLLAVIFGVIAIKRINASLGWRTGKGMAIAGFVLGLVGCGTLIITLLAAAGSGS